MPSRRPAPPPELKRSTPGWADLWFRGKALKHVVFKMQLDPPHSPKQRGDTPRAAAAAAGAGGPSPVPGPSPPDDAPDLTGLLSDELLLRILSHLPPPLRDSSGLVCKRWLRLLGRLRRSLTLLDWSFLDGPSRRLVARFPDLTDADLVPASIVPPVIPSGILLTRGPASVQLDSDFEASGAPFSGFVAGCRFLPSDVVDRGLEVLARGCPGLQKLSMVAVASELGMVKVADECPTLQELDLHRCADMALRPISAFRNLQILKLIGSVEGLYDGPGVSDIGLTILAHGCKRLVKLELSGCEGSYDGISAIGRCCLMLEELTLCDHRLDAGWMAGLSFCGNLKTLRLQGCRRIDADPGPIEHLGSCPAIERLHLQRCQLRDKRSLNALLLVCEAVREIVFQDCWGLDNDMFALASICRRVKYLSLEGCSLLTTEGLESVILSWKDLQRLRVVSCNKIRDSEVTPALSSLVSVLKELKWRPDSRSVLVTSLAGTGMGKKGGRFFKRT